MHLLLLSNSRHGGMAYLEHAAAMLRAFLPTIVRQVLFVPYAAVTKTHYEYVDEVRPAFERLGADVIGIHRAHGRVAHDPAGRNRGRISDRPRRRETG